MKMGLILALMLSLGCEPAALQTTDSAPPPPEPIPELGMHVTEECGQTAIGDTACNFALIDQNGEYWQLKHHLGEIVVLDFSAGWCGPCRLAAASTQAIQDDYENSAVIVTILIDGPHVSIAPTTEDISDWVTSYGITTAPVLQGSRDLMFDMSGESGYSIGGFPTYIYIDKNGTIYGGHSGFSDEYVRQVINSLL